MTDTEMTALEKRIDAAIALRDAIWARYDQKSNTLGIDHPETQTAFRHANNLENLVETLEFQRNVELNP